MACIEKDNGDRKLFSNLALHENEEEDEVEDLTSQMKKKKKKLSQRRRRRSSARFLRLTSIEDDEEGDGADTEHLGELYKRAIRMNAENRINAGNSWNLRLIENMDKLIGGSSLSGASSSKTDAAQDKSNHQIVNFTKASCTLDASVKIYSYRVDDVHLTSYRVLANLNRNDAVGNSKEIKNNDNKMISGNEEFERDNQNFLRDIPSHSTSIETLESNVAIINLSKLDSAYDIDPLFHKMSKTFDEGGARGLLLVNLCVGSNGSNIVFDSKEEVSDDEKEGSLHGEEIIDISKLTSKLESNLGNQSLENLELVPQLRTLRQEYAVLEQEGFIEYEKKISRRYATTQEEEKEAEISIHQEALERSMMSIARDSTTAQKISDVMFPEEQGVEPDFDGVDNLGGINEDFGVTESERCSSIGYEGELLLDDGICLNNATGTSAVLDALCSTNDFSQSDYQFFSQETMEKLDSDNRWAGSAHWKKTSQFQRKAPCKDTQPSNNRDFKRRMKRKKGCFVNLNVALLDMTELLQPAFKTKRDATALQLSKAVKNKYTKDDNLLPLDIGLGVEEFCKLFLRPNSVKEKDAHNTKAKTVGFHDRIATFEDGSFTEDEEAFALDFDDNVEEQEFTIAKLEGVRKVQKINVGFATVAKKVDVKRLKKDLWIELETILNLKRASLPAAAARMTEKKENIEKIVSFKETVNQMENHQSQSDVTLPFYFICLLHLANEKNLNLESQGMLDFNILSG